MSTPYHSKYYAYELTKRCSSDNLGKLSQSLNNATIDLARAGLAQENEPFGAL